MPDAKRQPDFRLTAGRCAPVIDKESVSAARALVKENPAAAAIPTNL